jgi:predicted ATPase
LGHRDPTRFFNSPALDRVLQPKDDLSSGRTLFFAGRFPASRSHLEEVLPLYNPTVHGTLVHQAGFDPQVVSYAVLGNVLFCLGYPGRALAQSSAAINEARGLAHPPSLAFSLAIGARVVSLVGDNAALAEWVDELVAVTAAHGFAHWGAQGAIYRGCIKIRNGETTEAMSLLRDGLNAYRATGAQGNMPYQIALLAAGCEIGGAN